MKLSFVGLGKLGLCTAACFASRGHDVIGFDIDESVIEKLKNKQMPITETGIEALLNSCWENLRFTTKIEPIIIESDITFIIVPTPSEADGGFSNDYVMSVLKCLITPLCQKNSFHIVNIVSTVMPGSSEKVFKPFLERQLKKVCGRDFGLAYNPEFVALGSVIENFLNPDLVLIGSSDQRTGKLLMKVYESIYDNKTNILQMDLINAEITKLSLNCYVTMKISFANELASICEKIPGADVSKITNAIGTDSRIGSKGIASGMGFGGPCFPRDNMAFQNFAAEKGVMMTLGKRVVEINHEIEKRIVDAVSGNISSGGTIGILGLSYKPDTHIIEASQSISIIERLIEKGYQIAVHDPMAMDEAKKELGERVVYQHTPYGVAEGAHGILLLTNWPIYQRLQWDLMEEKMVDGAVIYDSWLILKDKHWEKAKYIGAGLGAEE